MTTEPTESKSGDGTYATGSLATAEEVATSTVTGEGATTKKPNRTRPAFVPPLDPAMGIELRVTRAGMPARRLRINATRCTFGSGEGCTVRLSDTSLRPLHAVILQDNGRILIRGYSVPLEINGDLLAESFLALGDVVRLGQYCFEMIDLPVSSADDKSYKDETIPRSHVLSQPSQPVGEKLPQPSKHGRNEQRVSIDEAHSIDPASSQKRLKFSQPTTASNLKASRRSGSESVLEGLQFSQSGVEVLGAGDQVIVDEPTVREPVTSLAQIHVQAKRNSELLAELAAARQRERETDEKLVSAIQRMEATQSEFVQATQSIDELKAEVASLNDQVLKVTLDAQEQQSLAVAEQAKLNRAISTLRESGAASQKAEAATRQSLQESIRQRDEALAQRAVAIDIQQVTRTKLDEAEAQIRRMSQDAEAASIRLTRFESEAEKLRARIDELKDVCCGQADQITKLSTALETSQNSELAAVARLKDTVEQLQKELDASRQHVKTVDLQRVQLTTLQETLDSVLQQQITEKLDWSAKVESLNRSLESLSDELRSTTDDLIRSQNESATLKSQISEMRSQIANVETELTLRPTVDQLQESRVQLAQSEIDLENAERQLAELRKDYDQLASRQLASHRIADESIPDGPKIPYSSIGEPVANHPAEPLQSQSFTAPLPSSLFPVPAFSDSAQDDELPVEATHASNVQELVASAAAAFASYHSDSGQPRAERTHVDTKPATGSLAGDNRDANLSDSTKDNPSWPLSASSEGVAHKDSSIESNDIAADDSGSQSIWKLTSTSSFTEVMKGDTGEQSLHTEPMNRFVEPTDAADDQEFAAADFSPTSRFEDSDVESPSFLSGRLASDSVDSHLVEESAGQQPAEEDAEADEQSLLAALIQRSEGPTSSWFADYAASQRVDEEIGEPEDAEDNQAVLARLSQYVSEDDSSVDEIGAAIAESEYNGLDPETSALSLARMLINELDSATQIDRDSKSFFSDPDPMSKSKRLVGVAASEVGAGDSDESDDSVDQSPQVEMRRKDFDERAFRDALADAADDDVIDPNADEAAYSIQTEADRPVAFSASQPSQAVAVPDEEEDSVEAYMNQLLRRMGQEPLPAAKPVEDSPKPAANPLSATQSREPVREKPEIVRPRRPAPELEVPLDQMRELANESAQSAISTSNRKGAKEMRSKAMVDGAQASIVVMCALVFFYCGMTSSNLSLVWNTAGTLAIALSAFFFYEMFRKLSLLAKAA